MTTQTTANKLRQLYNSVNGDRTRFIYYCGIHEDLHISCLTVTAINLAFDLIQNSRIEPTNYIITRCKDGNLIAIFNGYFFPRKPTYILPPKSGLIESQNVRVFNSYAAAERTLCELKSMDLVHEFAIKPVTIHY
jgi:hypothetical protein